MPQSEEAKSNLHAMPDRVVQRSAAEVIQDIGRGAAISHLTDALQTVALAVTGTGKKGSVTLTIGLEPHDSDDTIVIMDAKVKTNAPMPTMSSLFFVDEAGNPRREDPRQGTINVD